MSGKIKIINAEEHNLKNINVEIPHNSITVITGVSGSGKSTLAYDVLYKESQRRYLESFSNYSRQFIGKTGRPKVEKITGLMPALAIDQKTVSYNPRSTVGTLSQISDYLRMLFAKKGKPICVNCGAKLENYSQNEIADFVSEKYKNKNVELFSRVVEGHKGDYKSKISELISKGFKEFIIDDKRFSINQLPELDKNKTHTIWVKFCDLEINEQVERKKILMNALKLGKGVINVFSNDKFERISVAGYCGKCGTEFPEIGSRLFSFNSKYGACESCKGLGLKERIDPKLLLADENKTLREGALVPTTPNGYIVYSQVTVDSLNEVCNAHGFDVDTPWNQLSEEQQNIIWYGSEKVKIPFGKHSLESRLKWSGITAKPREMGFYRGMLPIMEEILKRDRNDNILRFVSSVKCPDCNGTRLKKESLSVLIDKKNISQLSNYQISDLRNFLNELRFDEVSETIIEKINSRIKTLEDLGLGYLSLSREATTLSGGEAQRIRLATQIGLGLSGVLYILDEPSVGLHQRDNYRLINILKQLKNNGNTVVVVEHDKETILEADYLIDLGPGAGVNGGELLFAGTPDELLNNKKIISLTKDFLIDRKIITRENIDQKTNESVYVEGAKKFNLKNINVEFKQGVLNIVTGVSGAGKSTLVHQVIAAKMRGEKSDDLCEAIKNTHLIKNIIEIDQSPIGRTPRSNPATYTKLFDLIRNTFAETEEAKKRNYKKGRFSFNNKEGRCDRCEGSGTIEIGMHFLQNAEIICEKCKGQKFNDETLEINYQGKNIFDILELSIYEAEKFFKSDKKINEILNVMIDLGIGYLKLGQSSTTLSGGEAQRVKLSSELHKKKSGNTLYILDEPTTGLHLSDIKMLLKSLDKLIKNGNTVLLIEHNTDLIKVSDWIIDLGLEGGTKGGNLVAMGDLNQIIENKKSYTAKAIRDEFKNEVLDLNQKNYENIKLLGAKANNLKNIDVEIPKNKITVLTGVSGSGKTSLAFDTLYNEARQRFTESFSPNARRMMGKIKNSNLEECFGLTPAIAVNQKFSNSDPRSILATATDLMDYFRLLFSRLGKDKLNKTKTYSASDFSFNNPNVSCDKCKGLGVIISTTADLLITDSKKSFIEGAINGTKTGSFYGDSNGQFIATLKQVGIEKGINFNKPVNQLSEVELNIALFGTGDKEYNVKWEFVRKERKGIQNLKTKWPGFINLVNDEYERKIGSKRIETLKSLMKEINCPVCKGTRYKEEILKINLLDKNISEVLGFSVFNCLKYFNSIEKYLTTEELKISEKITTEIKKELDSLIRIGLGYLKLNRRTSSLSGGELRRVKLSNQLNSELTGVTYVLDEPTVGLHPRDTEKLFDHIKKINQNRNTFVIVEHEDFIIKNADHLIEIGPNAGECGGNITFEGSGEELLNNSQSLTGQYFYKRLQKKSFSENDQLIKINKASANNLQNIYLEIPLNKLVAVTGISGSGKTSLVFEVLKKSFDAGRNINCEKIEIPNKLNIISVDQKPLGTTPLSNILTYTGIFDDIKKIFALEEKSKLNGYKVKDFSFNSKGGRCENCSGMGFIKNDMDFLSDVWVKCEVCNGKRYLNEILSIYHNGVNISEVLESSASQAKEIFNEDKFIHNCLELLETIGLGYLKLGQGTNTMSGGEIQRLKLAKELLRKNNSNNLFLFDEPTTGLHKSDVEKLLKVFENLLDKNNSIIVVEHNKDIINNSDWVIDLGPEAGENGGTLIYSGEVKNIKNCEQSITAKFL